MKILLPIMILILVTFISCVPQNKTGIKKKCSDNEIFKNSNCVAIEANPTLTPTVEPTAEPTAEPTTTPNTNSVVAFPGAEGFGANSVGGRGGRVVKVTNLNDSGSGSLREAVTMNPRHWANRSTYQWESPEAYSNRYENIEKRIVVFEVSGTINLESTLTINRPYITIAGQTSPGGILLTGRQTTVNSHDVIIQHMRFRVGSHRIANGADPELLDSFDILGSYWAPNESYNIIIDHCSFSWGVDETVTIGGGVLKTTFSWNIVSEGLNRAGHPKGQHSKGLLISGKYVNPNEISVHHNYIAHNQDRSPYISSPVGVSTVVDVVNNISYNWYGGLSPLSGGSAKVNWISNYVKQGPESNDYSFEVTYVDDGASLNQVIYVSGNIGSTRLSHDQNEWNVGVHWHNQKLSENYRSITPFSTPIIQSKVMDHNYALEILQTVGATKPVRDSVDIRVVADFTAGTGRIIDNIRYPQDFPTFQNITPPIDSDNDGMSDAFEINNGLNNGANDSSEDIDNDGYTNIEEYLHLLGGY